MKPLREILQKSEQYLRERGIKEARLQAELLLADCLGMKRIDLYLNFDRPLSQSELDLCRSALTRRGRGEPLQYIAGHVDFLDCRIRVGPEVLIPRQETEILASKVIDQLQKENLEGKVLWDICCGSGCIGLSIKRRFPELKVVLSDISPEAVALAKSNAWNNELNAEVLAGDLFQALEGEKADYVVCNPPYISEAEFAALDREVRDFEPKLALVAADEGLAFYQRLCCELPYMLRPGGKAWLEIGYNQAGPIHALFSSPRWVRSVCEKDWAGHDRFFFLEIE